MRTVLLLMLLCDLWVKGFAHPMPNSALLLDIKSTEVVAELQLPLSELQLAFGKDLTSNSKRAVEVNKRELEAYILSHMHPLSVKGGAWKVAITGMQVQNAVQTATGPYQELTVQLVLAPPAGAGTRNFMLNYDVIVHQVVTHKAIVAIRQDWEQGQYGESTTEIGVIELDIPTNTIHPLVIHQQSGSVWTGFKSMINLGIAHIAEGTDHLLFLLVLLLPAPLLVSGRRWGGFGGSRYCMKRLLAIVTAFTLGHSLTLFAGAVGWLRPPSQPVEILIAVSILISAIHAIRPIFPGREIYIAAGFGLIHGLAFAGTLANLHLEPGRMALSILGFNMGIEIMQLFVIVLTVPWLIILSLTTKYTGIRIAGAIIAGIAAIAWIVERISGHANVIGTRFQNMVVYAKWLLPLLAVGTLILFLTEQHKKHPASIK